MIPTANIETSVPSPLPDCGMPHADEISEEGFGGFRGTWYIGRVSVRDAEMTVREEREVIEWLDAVAATPEEYELLATAIEHRDLSDLPPGLDTPDTTRRLQDFIGDVNDFAPLDGLEVGVAGLTHALSALRCLTAASCRWHMKSDSWSDTPVVYFAAPAWRLEILAELIAAEGCGLDTDRGMLFAYGRSILGTHRLARRILAERSRFRVERHRVTPPSRRRSDDEQLALLPQP